MKKLSDSLTGREVEVLQALWKNSDRKEAAASIFMAYPTLQTMVFRIYKKLQVNRLSAVFALLVEEGLFESHQKETP